MHTSNFTKSKPKYTKRKQGYGTLISTRKHSNLKEPMHTSNIIILNIIISNSLRSQLCVTKYVYVLSLMHALIKKVYTCIQEIIFGEYCIWQISHLVWRLGRGYYTVRAADGISLFSWAAAEHVN